MIDVHAARRIFFYNQPADLRKGFAGLYAMAQYQLKQNPLHGDLFVFINRRRTTLKALQWDGTGLCLFSKRLARGRFPNIWEHNAGIGPTLTTEQLANLLRGQPLSVFQQQYRPVA